MPRGGRESHRSPLAITLPNSPKKAASSPLAAFLCPDAADPPGSDDLGPEELAFGVSRE